MARFEGIPLFTGTFDTFCIYRMHGRYFMRSRSSLTSERVKNDPAFRKTRAYAQLLAAASPMASAFYATIPATKRQHALYRAITGEVMFWLKLKWKHADIVGWLQLKYGAENTCTDFEHTRLNPVYRRQTPILRPEIRLKEEKLETLSRCEEYTGTEFHRQEYVLRRRQVNKLIRSYAWAEGLAPGG